MRYLLVREEEIAGQMDTAYRPRVPDGRVILAENEAKGLDNFSAQFLSAGALKVLMEQPAPGTGGGETPSGGQPSGTVPEEGAEPDMPEEAETVPDKEPETDTPEEGPEPDTPEETGQETIQEGTVTLKE